MMARSETSNLASCRSPSTCSPSSVMEVGARTSPRFGATPTSTNMRPERPSLRSAECVAYRRFSSSSTSSRASSTDGEDDDKETGLTDATCIEFLEIMREFSTSSCKLSEAVERVDSLMHQDEHLQRLLPLKCGATGEDANDQDDDMRSNGEATTDDEGSADAKSESDRSEDVESASKAGSELELDLDMDEEQEREDLQRWMELELDIGGTLDAYEDALQLPSTATGTVMEEGRSDDEVSRMGSSTSNQVQEQEPSKLREGSEEERRELADALSSKLLASDTAFPDVDMQCDLENDDVNAGMWGMEVDPFERDMLTSLDHSVLCDRDNRFLQWDLEIEAAKAAASSHSKMEVRTPPASSSRSNVGSFATVDKARQKLLMEASPREHKMAHAPRQAAQSLDSALMNEDWNALDFGSFQNRTVSHILSSCLHKRKLHHPYKDNVTLISFGVPGGEAIGTVPSGSLPGSILFGSDDMGLTAGSLCATGKDSKTTKSGERKAKKPRNEERKRQNAQKLRETLAELEGTFTEHDLDTRGMPKIKFENLPLPDLANLPQDLKELKRKIEATEHKVEGTKHRHRKGGPCPRCQVQNQLRAAKRAYHKRAVAHKKLPQLTSPTLGVVTPTASPTSVASVISSASLAAAIPPLPDTGAAAFPLGVNVKLATQAAVKPTAPVVPAPSATVPSVPATTASAPVKTTPVAAPAPVATTSFVAPLPASTVPVVQYPARRLCGESAVAGAAFAATTSNPPSMITPAAVVAVAASQVSSTAPQLQQVPVATKA